MPQTETGENKNGNLLNKIDNALGQDEDDKEAQERLKHPFVKWAFGSLIGLLFMIFVTYFLSFWLGLPLPEVKFLESFMNIIVEVMKVLVPTNA